jgi:hypothetical protein
MAKMMMMQSKLMVKLYRQQTLPGPVSSPDELQSNASLSQVELRNGKTTPKSDIIRIMKRTMITESLKIPWLSMLTPELKKLVDERYAQLQVHVVI